MIRTMALALLLGVAAMGQAQAQSPGEAPGSSFAVEIRVDAGSDKGRLPRHGAFSVPTSRITPP